MWEHIYIDNDPSKGIAYNKEMPARGGPQTNGKDLFYTEILRTVPLENLAVAST